MIFINYLKKNLNYVIVGVLLISFIVFTLIFVSKEGINLKTGGFTNMTGKVIHSREASGNLVIKSNDIVSFNYEFTTNSVLYRGFNIPYEYGMLSMKKESDLVQVNIVMEGFDPVRLEFPVNLEKLKLLQDLVEKEKLATISGKYKKVAGIPEHVGSMLSIKYASDETIYAYDNTGHVVPNFTTSLIYDFFRELALEANQEDYASINYRLRSNQEYNVIARGNWSDKEGNYLLEFDEDKLRILENKKIIYDDRFSLSLGNVLNKEGRMKFGNINSIYIKEEEIIVKKFGQPDLIFKPNENYFIEMIQGFWQDSQGKYKLEFKESKLKIYEDNNLILDDNIFLEYGSIYLKDKKDKNIGPFRNLYARMGSLQVLPYVGEGEEKRIIFYPIAN